MLAIVIVIQLLMQGSCRFRTLLPHQNAAHKRPLGLRLDILVEAKRGVGRGSRSTQAGVHVGGGGGYTESRGTHVLHALS